MMWTFQAPQLSKSNSFTPGQSCWGSPRPTPQPRFVAKPPISHQPPHQPPQVFRSSVLSERYGRPASSSPRPCYSWRSRALEPLAPASLCVPPAKSPSEQQLQGLRPGFVSRPSPTLVRGRQTSLPRRTFKSVTRARTPPLHTRERNRQKVETASQEQQRAAETRYEKFIQPESFSVPKSFAEVQPSQPPPSLTNSASTISPAMSRHRPSDHGLSQDEHNSPSTVPQAFSDASSPDKENQPPLGGSGVVWEDPGSSSAKSPSLPATSPASEGLGVSPRKVLQPKDSNVREEKPMERLEEAKLRRKSTEDVRLKEVCEAPRRKSLGDAREVENVAGKINISSYQSSLVQEKISLWETMSTASRPAKTSTASTTGSRGRSSVSNSSWYRSFSDMARNMRQESAQMVRLMDRLREVGGDELGSPFSSHSAEASSPGEDLMDSPETQKIKAQLVDMHRHMKITKKMYRAFDGLLRMRSLEQAFNAEKSASLSLSTSPSSPQSDAAGKEKPKDLKDEDTTTQSEIDSSRHSRSTRSSQEVQDSPRYSLPNWMRDLKPQAEDPCEEEDAATASPCSSSPDNAPLPGQEGMPRHETFLYHLEQQELHRQVTLIVPEGMDETRRVNFMYEDQEMTVSIPEGYNVGQQVTVQVPTRKRPPLERNATQALHRGRQHLPDRNLVMENLRHCCRVTTSISLDHPEYKSRYQLYGMLQGKSMTPMLPEMPEADEEEASPGAFQGV